MLLNSCKVRPAGPKPASFPLEAIGRATHKLRPQGRQTRCRAPTQTACEASVASRLEQLNRIAVGIFNLNLFAARAYLHFISKMQTRLFLVSNACGQILHLKKHSPGSC